MANRIATWSKWMSTPTWAAVPRVAPGRAQEGRRLLAETPGAAYEHGSPCPNSGICRGDGRYRYAAGLLQHPQDWMNALAQLRDAVGDFDGIRVASRSTFTPSAGDLQPLRVDPPIFADHPHAWAKLWKHYSEAARELTDRVRQGSRREHAWLRHDGGAIGVERLFPNLLKTYDEDVDIFTEAQKMLSRGAVPREGGVWPAMVVRSTSQAAQERHAQRGGDGGEALQEGRRCGTSGGQRGGREGGKRFLHSGGGRASYRSGASQTTQKAVFLTGPRSVVVGTLPAVRLAQRSAAAAGVDISDASDDAFGNDRDEDHGDHGDDEEDVRHVLVDVEAVGICGSDLHYYRDGGIGSAVINEPFVPGHEFAGRLVKSDGPLGLAAGQLVAVDPARPCNRCAWCKRGDTNLCPQVQFLGAPPLGGGMTERLAVPAESLWAVPPGTTAVEALMLEPLGVALHALSLAQPRDGDTVCILGSGTIGILCAQLLCRGASAALKAAEAGEDKLAASPDHQHAVYGQFVGGQPEHVYIYDPVEARARLALGLSSDTSMRRHRDARFGAVPAATTAGATSWTSTSRPPRACDDGSDDGGSGGCSDMYGRDSQAKNLNGFEDGPAAVAAWTGGRGCDLVIEATNSPRGLYDATACAAIGGRVVVVGIPDGNWYTGGGGDEAASMMLQADTLRRKGLTVRWSRRMRGEDVYPAGIALLEARVLDLEAVATHRFPLDDAAEAFRRNEDYSTGVVKAVLEVR